MLVIAPRHKTAFGARLKTLALHRFFLVEFCRVVAARTTVAVYWLKRLAFWVLPVSVTGLVHVDGPYREK